MKNIQSIIFCAATLSVVATQYQTWGINSDRVHCVKEYSELIPKEIKKITPIAFLVHSCNGGGKTLFVSSSIAAPTATTGDIKTKLLTTTFSPSQLDKMPNRLQRLLNYQNDSILSKEGVVGEMRRLVNNQGFSPQVRRAAIDAQARSTAEFLSIQARYYGIEIDQFAIEYLDRNRGRLIAGAKPVHVAPESYGVGKGKSKQKAMTIIAYALFFGIILGPCLYTFRIESKRNSQKKDSPTTVDEAVQRILEKFGPPSDKNSG
jgi:hypothetical protein